MLPDYSFDIDESTEKKLSLTELGQLLVLSVLNIPDDITKMTANLAAPVIVNTQTRKGIQVVLPGVDYPIKHPIFEDMCRQFAADAAAEVE